MLAEVRQLLATRPRWLTMAALAHRAGVGLHWLNALHQGKIRDPGIGRLTKLHNCLLRLVEDAAGPPPRPLSRQPVGRCRPGSK